MGLLQMSISSAVLILAVIVIRALAIHKLPKMTFFILWWIVLFKLLIPFSVPSAFSVYSLINQQINAASRVQMAGENFAPSVEESEKSIFGQLPTENFAPVTEDVPAALPVKRISTLGNSVFPLFAVWLTGMILCAGFFTITYLRCRLEFSTSLPVRNDFVEGWLQEHPLMRPIDVRQSDRISAPLTYGIFKPVILVPKTTDWKDAKQLQYVFLHEYVHIRRFDAITKLICALALCVHWFNPLVWIMYFLFNRDMELACDESVVRLSGEASKKDYSLMLISMEAKKSGLLPFCSSFSKNAMEERITAIMKSRKKTVFSIALACLVVLGTGAAFATSARNNDNLASHEKVVEDVQITSYVDQEDGKTYYSFDGGKTYEALSEEEFAKRLGTSDIEWWTYDEYAAWLENEKVQLQNLIGEKGWTGSRGEFVWTQEIVDETIAMYENILQEIKNGVRYSKPICVENGDTIVGYYQEAIARETESGGTDYSVYEKILQDYLVSTKQWKNDYILEPTDPIEGKIGSEEVYKFELRYNETVADVGGRLITNYAISVNGKMIFWYDSANDEWIVERSDIQTNLIREDMNKANSISFSIYEPFGLFYNSDKNELTFENELVRYFYDGVTLSNGTDGIYSTYFNEKGTVDIHTIRQAIDNGDGSIDPFGKLVGIERYSQEEFDKRDLSDLINPSTEATYASENYDPTAKTFVEHFEAYKEFGIKYIESEFASGVGNVYYENQLVKTFLDVKPNGGTFLFNSDDGGTVTIQTIYNKDGQLIGMKEIK